MSGKGKSLTECFVIGGVESCVVYRGVHYNVDRTKETRVFG
jgi:hypothetical protein